MAAYASAEDVQVRLSRTMTAQELNRCAVLLEDAAAIIDSAAGSAANDAKKIVSCRMVVRAIGDGADLGVPVGATQGSMSALGYSQSWTINGGSTGELYLTKTDKQILGIGRAIGSRSPLESFAETGGGQG